MIIDPRVVSLRDIERFYEGETIDILPSCRKWVEEGARVVDRIAQAEEPVYGINTGFGKLASIRIPRNDLVELQKNLILSHCAGVGDPLPDNIVRLIMGLKMFSLAQGASGVRWEVISTLKGFLSHEIYPLIPSKGSVGASGDLAPLAHLTATLMGINPAFHKGTRITGCEALRIIGKEPVVLGPKEGLAMINGTQVSTALALAGLFEAWKIGMSSITSGALSTDAAMASSAPFREQIHELRGHKGQIDVARAIRELVFGSEIRESHRYDDTRVQDPYCIRCQPQVLGAAITTLRQAAQVLKTEATAVTDNPLILADGEIVSGGNFHGEPVGMAADMIAIAIAEMGSIAQRRVSLLVDPAVSHELPAFLAPNPGLHSGFMVAEIVTAALESENKSLANPRVVDSTPTSANQEDHVAMSCHGARRLIEMNDNLRNIISIELLCGAQGVELRAPLQTSEQLQKHVRTIREVSPFLAEDRLISPEIELVEELVRAGRFLPLDSPLLEEDPC